MRRLFPIAIACLLLAPLHAGEPPAQRVQETEPATAPPDQPPAQPEEDTPGPADAAEEETAPGEDPDAGLEAEADAGAEGSDSRVPLREIHRFVAVYNAVKEAYVDPVEDAELMQSAIRGLLLDLDPHSAYLSGDDARAFDESTTGAYGGIGVEVVRLPDGSMRVVAPIDDTPAARAGIRSGDVIIAVDGEPLTPASHDGAGPLRGAAGTSVSMTIMREDEAGPIEVTVEREEIRITSVRGRMLEPGYAYVRVSAFQVETANDFQRQVAELQQDGPLRGLVLDLRSNPGGLLTPAVQIADELLDEGRIVSTRGRHPISETEFSATAGDLLNGAPVVVIVDAGSASASEVLAGALGDHGRARIIGSRTFGKGSVQTVLPLDNGDSVKLTTARYYTPSGRSIQARGIDPDVVLQPDSQGPTLAMDRSEASLPGHLEGEEEGLPGAGAGDVLPGDGPIEAALEELKYMQPGAPPRPQPAPAAPDAGADGDSEAGTEPEAVTEAEQEAGPEPASDPEPEPESEPESESEPEPEPAP
ncbi:S41 family peptidase [Luteimonas sp. JM171]|uniref:S41 family peptidase n=1 Tax=Luteimonas sp. JM171 TaxID=1896164 RepID=UPI000AD4CBCC|nr:S41 family peptidase [Luteimonas sp. JM171]